MFCVRKHANMKDILVGLGLIAAVGFCFADSPSAVVPKFDTPILITTAGQSIDFETVRVLANRLKIQNLTENGAKPEDIRGQKTLVVVPGHSNKGLGSAGTNVAEEMQRVKALLAAAVKSNIPVVLIHLGGEVRRSADSDPFIAQVIAVAKCAIVWAPGNTDGYFTKQCSERKIPLIVIEKLSDLSGILKTMFPGN